MYQYEKYRKGTYTFVCHSNVHFIGVDNYDVVVMDPPWQNKSVRRKRK